MEPHIERERLTGFVDLHVYFGDCWCSINTGSDVYFGKLYNNNNKQLSVERAVPEELPGNPAWGVMIRIL